MVLVLVVLTCTVWFRPRGRARRTRDSRFLVVVLGPVLVQIRGRKGTLGETGSSSLPAPTVIVIDIVIVRVVIVVLELVVIAIVLLVYGCNGYSLFPLPAARKGIG